MLLAARAGKAVLCTKPLARDADEARVMYTNMFTEMVDLKMVGKLPVVSWVAAWPTFALFCSPLPLPLRKLRCGSVSPVEDTGTSYR